jgi:hypothetical protein
MCVGAEAWHAELNERKRREAEAEKARVKAAVNAARKVHEELLARKQEELKTESGAATRIQTQFRGYTAHGVKPRTHRATSDQHCSEDCTTLVDTGGLCATTWTGSWRRPSRVSLT